MKNILWFYNCLTCGGAEYGMRDMFDILSHNGYKIYCNIINQDFSDNDMVKNFSSIENLEFICRDMAIDLVNKGFFNFVINGIDNIEIKEIENARKNNSFNLYQFVELMCAVNANDLKRYDAIISPTFSCYKTNNSKKKVLFRGVAKDFLVDPDVKNRIIDKFGICGKKVIGRTGNISWIKFKKEDTLCFLSNFLNANKDWVYFIVGDYGSDLNLLLDFYKENGIDTSRLIFSGKYQRNEVWNFLSCMDVFFYTPLAESFGYVIVEAMMCGVPVVTTNVGAIPETIINGENGFIVNPNKTEDLRVIQDLIYNKNNIKNIITENAKKFAYSRHNFEDYSKNVLDLFK